MRILTFVRSRLWRDRTATLTIAALAAVVAAGAIVGVAAMSDADASSLVNPFLVPLLLGVLLSAATADALGRPRVAEELERVGWTRWERIRAFGLERTAAITVGLLPAGIIGTLLVGGAPWVVWWMFVGTLVTSLLGEIRRSRPVTAFAPASSAGRILGAVVIFAFGLISAAWISTGVTNGSGMALAVPAAIVAATVAGAAVLPFVIGGLPSAGWARAALRPLRRDRRRIRAALVVILPCMMLMALMSVFQPSFEAREADRLGARDAAVVEERRGIPAHEMWITTGASAFDLVQADDPGSTPSPATPEERVAALGAATDMLDRVVPDATVIDVDVVARTSGVGHGPWSLYPPGVATVDASSGVLETLARYSSGLDVVVATPELLAALDPTGATSIPEGGALVFDRALVTDGVVTLHATAGDEPFSWPARVVDGRSGAAVPVVLVSPDAIDGLDVIEGASGLFVTAPAPIDEGVAAVISRSADVEVHDAWSWFDTGGGVLATPQEDLPFVPADLADVWRLLITGALIALVAIAVVVVGSMLDRGEEYEVLHREGASQVLRRSIAALQAGVVLSVAAAFALGVVCLCSAVGFADYNALDETTLGVPWRFDPGLAAVVLIVVPAAGAALAATVAPQRRRSGGVIGGRLRPMRAHA